MSDTTANTPPATAAEQEFETIRAALHDAVRELVNEARRPGVDQAGVDALTDALVYGWMSHLATLIGAALRAQAAEFAAAALTRGGQETLQ